MNIEEVAKENPHAIIKEPIDIFNGMSRNQAVQMAAHMGFDPSCIDKVEIVILIGYTTITHD